jgi:hypothetical protein
VLYACDGEWWDVYYNEVKDLGCELWTQDIQAARKYGLKLVIAKQGKGLGRDGIIHWGANSGYQAINLAYLWGASRIILLGYDCKNSNGKAHWFGQHPSSLNQYQPLHIWAENFGQLARDLKDEGLEVLNCSPDTALECFERESLWKALSK